MVSWVNRQSKLVMRKFSQIHDIKTSKPPFGESAIRKLMLLAGLVLLMALILVAGYYFGRPIVSKWTYERDLQDAERYESEGDRRSAMLTLEQVNRLHPMDAEARRRLAAFYERIGEFESLTVWKEAVDLEPDNPQGHLGLAQAALRFGDRELARRHLQHVSLTPSQSAEYYRLRAALALLDGDLDVQEENLAQLSRLEPADERVRLNLATIRLRDPHGPRAEAARVVLLELARNDRIRIRAVVELISDVVRRWPTPGAERDAALRTLAGRLTPPQGPQLGLPSQLNHVDRLVDYAMQQPDPTVEDVIVLANWMSVNGQTGAALQWIDLLPAQLTGHDTMKKAAAGLAIRVGDWARLRGLLLAGAWGKVPAAAVEQVFRARDQAGSPPAAGVRPGWPAALEAAKASPAGLRMLLRLTETWAWPAEQRQVLHAIARTFPRETWAWRRLISLALARSDSDQLWQVYLQWRLTMPGDPVVQVESSVMGYLLSRRRVPPTTETAELLGRRPDDPGAAVAHALALRREGRLAEAVAVLDARPRAAFVEPRHALAAGVILAEAGRPADSDELLEHTRGTGLLPEEQALLNAARERNRGARP